MLRNQPNILHLWSISLKEGKEPTPVFWYWILMELLTIPFLEHCSGAKYKLFASYYCNFCIYNRKIFHFDGFQPHHSPAISSMHMFICIHYTLSILLLEFTMVVFHFLYTYFLPGTFHFLTEPGFFPVHRMYLICAQLESHILLYVWLFHLSRLAIIVLVLWYCHCHYVLILIE